MPFGQWESALMDTLSTGPNSCLSLAQKMNQLLSLKFWFSISSKENTKLVLASVPSYKNLGIINLYMLLYKSYQWKEKIEEENNPVGHGHSNITYGTNSMEYFSHFYFYTVVILVLCCSIN